MKGQGSKFRGYILSGLPDVPQVVWVCKLVACHLQGQSTGLAVLDLAEETFPSLL